MITEPFEKFVSSTFHNQGAHSILINLYPNETPFYNLSVDVLVEGIGPVAAQVVRLPLAIKSGTIMGKDMVHNMKEWSKGCRQKLAKCPPVEKWEG